MQMRTLVGNQGLLILEEGIGPYTAGSAQCQSGRHGVEFLRLLRLV